MKATHNPPTTALVTPADLLRMAALYLRRHGWHQGSYYDTLTATDNPTPPACAVGAIGMACAGHRVNHFSDLPTDDRHVYLDAIAALFGLTAAEKRVAGHVADGSTRGEIAASSGVSDGTVKSQLAAIFDKTGTSHQRELQLLIRELSPPVSSD